MTRIEWLFASYFIKDKPISLAEYPFMIDPYADESKIIVGEKSAQCGFSELLVGDSLYLSSELGLTVAYYFPKQTQANDFSQHRINGAINSSPAIKSKCKDLNNVKLKQIGKGYIYVRGTESRDNIVSVPCDCIMRDEEDMMNYNNKIFPYKEMVPMTEARLGASKYKLQRLISNPRFPNQGIDKLYNESDRKQWFIKCEHCNERQILKFPDSIDFKKAECICLKCGQSIDRNANGEWVAEFPDREVSGYHISQLFNRNIPIAEIIKASEKDTESEKQIFYNFRLGLARNPEGAQINRDIILRCTKPDYRLPGTSDEFTTAGIDVGPNYFKIRCSKLVNNQRQAVYIGDVKELEDLISIMKRYKCNSIVIDAQPERRTAEALYKALKGKVTQAYFTNITDTFKLTKVDNLPAVDINRTIAFDLVYSEFTNCNNILPCNIEDIKDYISQILAVTRTVSKDKNNNDVPEWVSTGDDHYFLAEVYDKIAGMIKPQEETIFFKVLN
jgi:hypothetical protein